MYVKDIGCNTSDETARRIFIDIFKGERLDIVEHILPQIFCQSAGRGGAGAPRQRPEGQGQAGHDHQLRPIAQEYVHAAARLDVVDEIGDDEGDDALHDHLAGDQYGGKQGRRLVLADAAGQSF